MGLLINIYRPAGDDKGSDLTDGVDRLTVINIDGPFAPSIEAPAVKLERHFYYPSIPLLVPVDLPTRNMRGPMAGSNYAGAVDSRWHEAVAAITGVRGDFLVRIHDRYEEVSR